VTYFEFRRKRLKRKWKAPQAKSIRPLGPKLCQNDLSRQLAKGLLLESHILNFGSSAWGEIESTRAPVELAAAPNSAKIVDLLRQLARR
jgi:hypothetical protein